MPSVSVARGEICADLRQTFYVALATAALSLAGSAAMPWLSVKKKKKESESAPAAEKEEKEGSTAPASDPKQT
jgi:hypothetical protein